MHNAIGWAASKSGQLNISRNELSTNCLSNPSRKNVHFQQKTALVDKQKLVPIICCDRLAFLCTKFPRYDWTSNDHVCVQNNNPVNIFRIFTMFQPVNNSSRFIDCRVPAKNKYSTSFSFLQYKETPKQLHSSPKILEKRYISITSRVHRKK